MTNPAENAPEEGAPSAPENPAAETNMPALRPEQGEMPFAMVRGEAVTELPKDLYIPPQALEVFLDAFEGPLDLLLYLIRRQNLDILDIDVAQITEQYMRYVELMDAMQFELAAEYLLMAAMLAEIKSRMLLPRSGETEEEEEDPRANLVRRLQEYERFKKAAEDLEVPFLGTIPFDPGIVRGGDDGVHRIVAEPDGVTAESFIKVVDKVMDIVESGNRTAVSIR